ncbi:MAG: TraR/DksA C4-type zinc finger protein [Syntrophales bacterium]|jgi:DnaK suppressor protein|nr:TraR/DksA C4-type zinc finger protein [Syntrophales bacterium]MDY0043405.1 TraR/DksA C4-type zinc finger protein [Syntrophales bacterium]
MNVRTAQVKKLRNLLKGKMVTIQHAADETLKDLRNHDENPPDFYDQATIETDRNINLLLRELDRQSVQEMDEAIQRIQKGTFGRCKACNKQISAGRLKANPMATLCINCKKKEEKESMRMAKSGGWSLYEMEPSDVW